MRKQLEELARKNVQYIAEIERWVDRCKAIEKQMHKQSVKMVKMRLGLEFYGDDKSYRTKYGGHIENKNIHTGVGADCGKLARKILSEIKDN